MRQQVTNYDAGVSGLSGAYRSSFSFFFSLVLSEDTNLGINWMVHIESLLRMFRRAFNCPHCSPGKGDLKASRKQDVLSINTGAILFTIKVVANLLFAERENTGEALERGSMLGPGAQGT